MFVKNGSSFGIETKYRMVFVLKVQPMTPPALEASLGTEGKVNRAFMVSPDRRAAVILRNTFRSEKLPRFCFLRYETPFVRFQAPECLP